MDKDQKDQIAKFLNHCIVIDINEAIKEIVIDLRGKYRLKLPDSIVISTSLYIGIPLITSDKKLFKISEIDIIEYHL